jgi:hypothetical protein
MPDTNVDMSTAPPLPEPGVQSPADRRVISQRFILHAREDLERDNRLQAGEKAWGAVAQYLKIIGEQRGWYHKSHRQLDSIGRHLVAEYDQAQLAVALSDAYHKGHENFYDNQRNFQEIEETIEEVEEALPVLESLQYAAPLPFTINSNRQLRRLIELTGNQELAVGDASSVGFSLRHPPAGSAGPKPAVHDES